MKSAKNLREIPGNEGVAKTPADHAFFSLRKAESASVETATKKLREERITELNAWKTT